MAGEPSSEEAGGVEARDSFLSTNAVEGTEALALQEMATNYLSSLPPRIMRQACLVKETWTEPSEDNIEVQYTRWYLSLTPEDKEDS